MAHMFDTNKYLKRYYHIDFGRAEITERKSYHPEASVKRMKFQSILEVKYS